jgi:hypothetical protein
MSELLIPILTKTDGFKFVRLKSATEDQAFGTFELVLPRGSNNRVYLNVSMLSHYLQDKLKVV